MRKLAIAIVAILALLVVGVVAAPALIDWKRFEPKIAQAVHDATSRDFRIDGEVDLTLVPAISVRVNDLHLANPPGFEAPDMVSIGAIEGRIALWPLITGRVVVERLIVQDPDVALAVDADGRPNWLMEPAEPAPEEEEDGGEGGLPIADLSLDDVRIVDGAVAYRDAVTGQALIGRDLNVEASLDSLDAPLDVHAAMTLNDEAVTLVSSIYPLESVFTDDPGRVALSLASSHLDARLDAGVQAEPLFGLDGQASIDVPSVGQLAAWLDVPYDTDPGPLHLHARFESDGPRVALQQATIEGDDLSVRASASLEMGGEATRVTAKLNSGVLDIDRYLPPPRPDAPAHASAPSAGAVDDVESARGTPLDMLPDSPLDLSPLRKLVADVDLGVEGVRVAGYEAGPIHLTATADDGVIVADLDQLGLYGGTIGGSLRLDARADTLAARTNLTVANVDVGELTKVGAGDPPPAVGIASGRLLVTATGRTVRELARSSTGEIDASLRSAGGPKIAGQLTALSLAADRPTVDADLHLRGSAVYGGEQIRFDLQSDRPIGTFLLGEPITVNLGVESGVLTTSYQGRAVPGPVTSLDGEWRAEIPSVAKLSTWLGRPWPKGRPDPGAIAAHARLESDGRVGAIETATIKGEGLDLEATGSFDASGDPLKFDLVVDGGVLDLDRYLPAGGEAAGSPASGARHDRAGSDDPLAALSDEPFDLTPLRDHEGRIAVKLGGLRVAGIELGAIDLEVTLENAKLAAELARLTIAGGSMSAKLDVDGAGDGLGVDGDLRVTDVAATELDAVLSGSGISLDGRASAELKLSGRGASPRQLLTGATGRVALDLPGLELDEGPIATVAATEATVELAGIEAGPQIAATTTLQPRSGGDPLAVDLKAELGPLRQLLADASLPLDAIAEIGTMTLQVAGEVAGLNGTPRPDLKVRLEGDRLKDLDPLTGADLPDVAPYSLTARVTTEDRLYRIADLATRLGNSDLGGQITVELGGERPRVDADLRGQLLDLAELTATEETGQEAGAAGADQAGAAQPTADEAKRPSKRLIPDDPLPLDALRTLDASLSLAIAKVRGLGGGDVDQFAADLELADGNVTIAPFTGKSAGGDFTITLDLETNQRPANLEFDYQATGMLMGTFVEFIKASGESVGKADIDMHLVGSGDSPHALASSLDGHVKVIGKGGSVDSTVMQFLSIGLGDLFEVFGDSKENTYLNCFVMNFDVADGIATTKDLLVDFPSLSIAGVGTVDLGDEKLDLQFTPTSKNASFVSLAVPFDVKGRLADPKIRPDAAGTGLQVFKGAALAALYLNPITGVPMAAATAGGALVGGDLLLGAARENPCVVALQRADATGEVKREGNWLDRLKGVFGGG